MAAMVLRSVQAAVTCNELATFLLFGHHIRLVEALMSAQTRKLPERRTPAWRTTLDQRRETVMQIPGVIGIGISGTQGNEHVVVTVRRGQSVPAGEIRRTLTGMKVEFEEADAYRLR